MSEWISVKDRLPEEGEENRVIIFSDKRAPFLPEVLWGYYELKEWHTQWGICKKVTHWQPLPLHPSDCIAKPSKPDRRIEDEMELSELKALVAASLLGGSVTRIRQGSCMELVGPSPEGIAKAVQTAGEIWKEVLRQERK